jgi:protoheme IX farnesyltransferase
MGNFITTANTLKDHYWPLIKSRQTFLLALTGVAGYLCERPVSMDWPRFASLVGSLLVTIGGCTVLNMVFDRDIDQKMARTRQRPLAAMQTHVGAAAALGSALIVLGLLWALSLSVLYFSLALAGAGLDVLVYTLWLKRRSAWSILWGGLSGGIPILASRALVVGRVDATGLLLAFAIVGWIPSHNLTLGMLYSEDYLNAGVPTFIRIGQHTGLCGTFQPAVRYPYGSRVHTARPFPTGICDLRSQQPRIGGIGVVCLGTVFPTGSQHFI